MPITSFPLPKEAESAISTISAPSASNVTGLQRRNCGSALLQWWRKAICVRVTISHKKPKQEVVKLIDQNMNDMINGLANGPIQIADMERTWTGDMMNFTFKGKAGFFSVPIAGFIEVTDKEVIVEAALPGIFTKLVPEEKLRTGIEGKIRGYLA